MDTKKFLVLTIFILTILMFAGNVSASTIIINPQMSNTLTQAVINNSCNGDAISVIPVNSTYQYNLVIDKSLNFMSNGATMKNANSSKSLVTVGQRGHVMMRGITFANSNCESDGGAIYNYGNLTITNCTFINNNGYYGGAIYNYGSLTITNCTFTNNNAKYGGAIYNDGILTATGNTFTNNNASNGGSAICNYGLANVNFNRIVENENCGLYNKYGGMLDANNNWWGSNKGPVVPSDISWDINANGTANYNSWLIMSTISPGIVVTQSNSLNIPVYLTYNNQGEDTSSLGHIVDRIPIEFTTNMGTINNAVFTMGGTAFSTLNFNTTTGNVTASLDNQTIFTIIQGVFNNIQSAINNTTQNSSIINIEDGNYTENIILNKQTALISVNAGNVIIQPLDPTKPVITVTGNNTIICGLNINGATSSDGIYINSINSYIAGNVLTGNQFGIYLDNALNSTIYGNDVINNVYGIYVFNSTNSTLYGNNVLNNTYIGIYDSFSTNSTIYQNNILNNLDDGIYLATSNDSLISENTISNNYHNGISFDNSLNSTVYRNDIKYNGEDGIYLYNSSANINFNIIYGNGEYGLKNQGNGTVNATNNWWGSNANPSSSIYSNGGSVTSNPWLVLSINSSCDYSNSTGTNHNYIITADLTHNSRGNDTSSSGSIPNGTVVNFLATLGTINATTSTSSGKTTNKLINTSTGTTTVSVTLDSQTVITSISVTNTTVLGVYSATTGQWYNSIQDAINVLYYLGGGVITLADGTYTENVVVCTNVTIMPAPGANVTVRAADLTLPVFIIGNNGSTISGLNIQSGLCGIYMYNVSNCNITGNTISNNNCGVYFDTSNSNNVSGNTIVYNDCGVYFDTSNSNNINGNTISHSYSGIYINANNNITGNNISNNVVGIVCIDLNSSFTGNNITNSLTHDVLQINTTGVVMVDTYYNCGPASLATVLQNYFNITVSQDELATLAGTDESGTSMYGLAQAAQHEGFNAYGLRLSVNELEPGDIVYLTTNGGGHFSVISSITNTTVYLADSYLGNINMTRAVFEEEYSGYALFITNNTDNTRLINGTILTNEEMQELVGTDWIYFSSGGTWTYSASSTFVGTIWAPVVTGDIFTWTDHIDFHGTSGSTLYDTVTVNNWGNNSAYTLRMTLTVYSNSGWTGTILYQATQSYDFIKDYSDSYTFVFNTPDLGGSRSYSWSGSCYNAIIQHAPYFNLYKANKVINGILLTAGIVFGTIGTDGADLIPLVTTGTIARGAPFAIGSSVYGGIFGGFSAAWNNVDPTWINEDYGSQIGHIIHTK